MTTLTLEDIRAVAYDLQRVAAGFRGAVTSDFAAALEAHTDAVKAVNERLRAAHTLLRQGRRAEAIHACDADPNLLDCVQELDAGDQLVAELLASPDGYGLDAPERLLSDLAMELSAAYDAKHQLASLTRVLRLLAIGRGPLEERVSVLRKIAAIDVDNPVWIDDLRTHEEQCQKELRAELDRITRLPEPQLTETAATRAQKLGRRLCESDWQDPLPGAEVERVRKSVEAIGRVRGRLALRKVVADLAAAHGRGDLAGARKLCDRWDALEFEAGAVDEDATLDDARTARNWVAEHEAQEKRSLDAEAAAADLRHALVGGSALRPAAAKAARQRIEASLSRLRVVESASDRAADVAELVAAAQQRLAELARVPFRFWGVVGGVACVAVAITGWTGMNVYRHLHREAAVAEVRDDVLDDSVALQDLVEKWEKWVKRHSWLPDHPIADDVDNRRRALETEKVANRTAVQRKLDALAQTVARLPDVTRNHDQGATERGQAKTALSQAQAAIDDADKAVGDFGRAHPQADVQSLRDAVSTNRAEVMRLKDEFRAADERLRKDQVDRIEKAIVSLENSPDRDRRDEDLKPIRQLIEDYADLFGKSQPEWEQRLEAITTRIADDAAFKRIRDELAKTAGQGVAAYLDGLAKYQADKLPHPARPLPEAAATVPAVKAALAWSDVAAEWDDKTPFDPTKATQHKIWRDALRKALDASPRPVDCSAVARQTLDRLVVVLDEQEKDRGFEPLALLKHELTGPIMQSDVMEFRPDKDVDAVYYTTGGKRAKGLYFRDERTCDKWMAAIQDTDGGMPAASHAALANAIKISLKKIASGELGIDDGLDELFRLFPAQGADKLLQCKLLVLVIDALQQREAFRDIPEVEQIREAIAQHVGLEPAWVDPRARDGEKARLAADILDDKTAFKAVRDGYIKWRDDLKQRPAWCRRLVFCGWLDRDGDSLSLRSVTPYSTSGDGQLVAVLSAGDDSFRTVTIGHVNSGKPTALKDDGLVFGLPVFLEARR
jgi:hypothetical protein